MSSKLKKKVNTFDIILALIVLVLIIISLVLVEKVYLEPKKIELVQNNTATTTEKKQNESENVVNVPVTEQEIIKKLSTMDERDRMEYYFGIYFKHLENKEYDEAYKLLYPDFKEKYFPSVGEFKEYILKTYPEKCSWVDDDISSRAANENKEKREYVSPIC